MASTWRLAALLILFCVLGIQGQRQGADKHTGIWSADDSDWSELKSSMEKMHVAMMSIESTGKPDVDFIRLMIPHHQAAIDMAKSELIYGKDPQMRRLAQEIITDQQSEIELMQLWLKQHTPTLPRASQAFKPGARKEQ